MKLFYFNGQNPDIEDCDISLMVQGETMQEASLSWRAWIDQMIVDLDGLFQGAPQSMPAMHSAGYDALMKTPGYRDMVEILEVCPTDRAGPLSWRGDAGAGGGTMEPVGYILP